MLNSGPDLSRKGACSARRHNCGAHALTHRFIKLLINGKLDALLTNPKYQFLLDTFKKVHAIPAETNLTWNHIKQLCCYYTHPYDREIVFGDVFREFFGEIIAANEDYKQSRQEHFIMLLTLQIRRWNNINSEYNHQAQDAAVDIEFILNNESVLLFATEVSELFNQRASGQPNKLDFLERHINDGFYTQFDIQEKINTFWNSTGFAAWIDYIKTPYVLLPIDVLMNGGDALEFDVEVEIAGGYTWNNKIEMTEGYFAQRPFSLKAFNLEGIHYEVELDSALEAQIHNTQLDGLGVFEELEKAAEQAHLTNAEINQYLRLAQIQAGKLQGRRIRNDDNPSPEIRQFLRTLPVSNQDQASWIASFNARGRADRNKPRSERKTVKSAYISIMEWARFEVSLYQQIQSNPTWVSTWHQALYDLSQIKDLGTLSTWCTTYLRPLSPFDELPQDILIGWASENIRLHEDFDPLLDEPRQAQPGKTISEAAWIAEQFSKGDTLSTLLLIYDEAIPENKHSAYNLIFEEWQKYNAHSLHLWMSYKERPVAYALEAAERILNLAIDLEGYLPEAAWPNPDDLEHYVETNNLLALYHERQRLYQYQFSPAIQAGSSMPTSSSNHMSSMLAQSVGGKRTEMDFRPSTEISEMHHDKKKKL